MLVAGYLDAGIVDVVFLHHVDLEALDLVEHPAALRARPVPRIVLVQWVPALQVPAQAHNQCHTKCPDVKHDKVVYMCEWRA